jgi:hypothetical protein
VELGPGASRCAVPVCVSCARAVDGLSCHFAPGDGAYGQKLCNRVLHGLVGGEQGWVGRRLGSRGRVMGGSGCSCHARRPAPRQPAPCISEGNQLLCRRAARPPRRRACRRPLRPQTALDARPTVARCAAPPRHTQVPRAVLGDAPGDAAGEPARLDLDHHAGHDGGRRHGRRPATRGRAGGGLLGIHGRPACAAPTACLPHSHTLHRAWARPGLRPAARAAQRRDR